MKKKKRLTSNKYATYETEKQKLYYLPPEEYEKAIRALARRLKL